MTIMTKDLHKIWLLACIFASLVGLSSCGEYQQILKSKDPDFKYQKALMYFEDEQYVKAQTLLDEVTSYYRAKTLTAFYRLAGVFSSLYYSKRRYLLLTRVHYYCIIFVKRHFRLPNYWFIIIFN